MAAAPQKQPVAENTEADKKGGKKKLLLIIGLALLLVAISVGGTLITLKFLAPDKADEQVVEEDKAPQPLPPAIYYELSPNFTINFNVNGRQRFLQAQITLLYRDEELEPLLKLHMPVIRNGLVMLLSSKNFAELQTTEGKESLRAEALKTVRDILEKEQVAAHAGDEKDEDEKDKDKDKDEKDADKKGDEHPPEYPNVEQVLFTNFVMQ